MTTFKKKISNAHISKVQAFLKSKVEVEKFIQSWLYRQDLSLDGNLRVLAQKLTECFGLDTISKRILQDYLIESNIPIEVTLRPLRPSQLINILEQWIECNTYEESSKEKKKSIFRNSLFRKVFSDQEETINEYFSLNSNNMLIADDLFNLLQEMTNQYFLYDCQDDGQAFFQKENSLIKFKEVVSQFGDHFHQEQGLLYIKQNEFQELIQFWQQKNPDLLLLDAPRRPIQEISIQTEQVKAQDVQVQASESVLSFMDILNSTIAKLNAVTAETASQRDLRAIERICSFIKNEQIALLKRQAQNEFIQKDQNCDGNQDQLTRFSTKDHKKLQIKYSDQFNTFTPKHTNNNKWTSDKKLSKESYSPKLYMTQLSTKTYRRLGKQYNPHNI